MERYIRLLSNENVCKLQAYINKKGGENFATITPGGLSMRVTEAEWPNVMQFILGMGVRYEFGDVPLIVSHLFNNIFSLKSK